jgi:hypothetical protein
MKKKHKLMQFDVTAQRVEYREHTFRVKACDTINAHAAGLRAANDYDFRDAKFIEAKESVVGIRRVEYLKKEQQR